MVLDLPMQAIVSLAYHNARDALTRFWLFNNDVEGATLSFRLFDEVRVMHNTMDNDAVMYHASCFVCAVRRAGRLLKYLSANGGCFRAPVADVIRLEWRKKRTFFDAFVEPRNAIEHIDAEVSDKTKWAFFNMQNDRFFVVNGVAVDINQASLETLRSARDAIADAIVKEYRSPTLDLLGSAGSSDV